MERSAAFPAEQPRSPPIDLLVPTTDDPGGPLELCAFDLETTGLSPRSDRIIEIGAVRFGADGRVHDRLDLLVDPGMPVPVAIQRLTGLGDADLAGATTAAEAVAMLADFAEGALLVAHGAAFDLSHCAVVLPDVFGGRRCVDTLELARILLPAATSHSLPLLAGALGIEHPRPHRAGDDAEATRQLLLRLVERAEDLPQSTLDVVRRYAPLAGGGLVPFFTRLVAGPGRADRPQRAGARPAPAVAASAAAPHDTPRPLDAVVAEALGPAGAMAAADPAFELREAQVEMGRAVAQTLERSGRLIAEVGTGTGKSYAYLVPLALWSARTGRRAVVATHTVTLQEQLAERDLPLVLARLGIPARTAMLKGRRHYLSLRRFERLLSGLGTGQGRAADPDVVRFVLRVLCWLAETGTGDRGELRLGGVEEELWRHVESTVDDCLGAACANWRDGACYMVAARRNAADADMVVTNHALLVADSERQGQVIGEYAALVVDEAQHLEATATRQLGTRLRAHDVIAVIDRLRLGDGEGGDTGDVLRACRDAAVRLFGDVKGFVASAGGLDQPGNAVHALTEAAREDTALQPLLRAASLAVSRLRRAAAALLDERGRGALLADLLPQPDRGDDELSLAAAALSGHADAVDRVLLSPRPRHVAWLEVRAEQSELREAPLSVDGALAERLFEDREAVVLTSATLAVGGSFEHIAERTGLRRAATLRLPSPFDYLSQALTVIVPDMPPYDMPDYDTALARTVADIALRLGGRTLVLFTGYAALRSAHHLLGHRLEVEHIAVLGQGIDGTRRQVLASFVQNPRTVLLGTSTFWEGVDIPGDALRCVVIAKLPFPVPSDPLVAARSAELADPFGSLALPEAVLRLRQGFGRLIRHGDDRGAVVLCDVRLLARDYGRSFIEALPEAAAVRVPSRDCGRVVEEFVAGGGIPESLRLQPATAGAPGYDDEGVA